MNVSVYLSKEGFEETRRGVFFSREIGTSVTATASPELWDVTNNGFTYQAIRTKDLATAINYLHSYSGTSLVVLLYNLQLDVISSKLLRIKEDI